ncbi:MAG: hypothetical protein Q4G11_06980 [Gallicola sp.]|nr:hypothetical protein [Gallicola sp.]
MLKQRIKNYNPLTVDVTGSDGDIVALQGIMAGEVERYDLKAQGGTEMKAMPAVLNRKNLVVGAKTATGRISCYLALPHVKASSTYPQISASIIGQFDASYESAVKADYANMKFDA